MGTRARSVEGKSLTASLPHCLVPSLPRRLAALLPHRPVASSPRYLIALFLYVFLFAVYLLSYSGLFHSSDAISMFAVAESMAKRGQVDSNQLWGWAAEHEEEQGSYGQDGEFYSKYEIGVSLLAAPLVWIALHVPRLGLVQTAMLLNTLLTPLTAVLVFLFVVGLGYRRATAVVVALVFGLCTLSWVYAKYFFSEPVAALGLFAAWYGLWLYRRKGAPWLAGLAGLAWGLAQNTRLVHAIALPLLALYGFYRADLRAALADRRYRTAGLAFGLVAGAALGVVGLYNAVRFGSPLDTGRLPLETFSTPFMVGLTGLLFGRQQSIFVYSPALLLALPALPAFYRRHRREALFGVAIFFAYVLVYARWVGWSGGLAWGPRYHVPILPFLAVMTAPAIQWLLDRRFSLPMVGFVALCLFSVVVQVAGVGISFRWYRASKYYDRIAWPITEHLAHFRLRYLDLAWAHRPAGVDTTVVGLTVAVALLALAGLIFFHRRPTVGGRALLVSFIVAALVVVGLSGFSLSRYYDDVRYHRGYGRTVDPGDDYHALVEHLRQRSSRRDVLLVADRGYMTFFMNYDRARLEWYALPKEEPPLSAMTTGLLARLAGRYDRVWLAQDRLAAHPDPKPVEQWLAGHAYRVEERVFGEFCRLSLFSTGAWAGRDGPRHPLAFELGPGLRLDGYSLEETVLRPGQPLRLALRWRATAPLAEDYTVFVQLLDDDGRLRTGHDSQPANGFRPTSAWPVGETIRDNHSWPLPDDLPPGRYRLVTGMYLLRTMERLPVRSGGQVVGDYVLLDEIDVVDGSG